jgi:hypothetical protein
MKKVALLVSLTIIVGIFIPFSYAKELPKVAVWDLVPRETKGTYAQELTSILVSEVSKLGKYEVYSQENVRTLAGWTAERMQLGCTDTKCLTALGQMDIAKLISGSVGKIGNTFSISLNLFDTQNAKAENAVSEFCRTEDELIPLVQQAVRKLLGAASEPSLVEEKRKPAEAKSAVEEERKKMEEGKKREELYTLPSPKAYRVTGRILEIENDQIELQKGNERWRIHVDENILRTRLPSKGVIVTVHYTMRVLEILVSGMAEIRCSTGFPNLRKYQVTGPILGIKDTIITLQKGDEKWELGCEHPIENTDVVKRGGKATLTYQLLGREILPQSK